MANNMTIGPALSIGGNTVEMTTNGKVQVTNTRGKVKTLSQDQFKKQLIKNADKIEAGQDFEFKKDHKTAKVIGAGLATAAVVTGAIYRKEIGQYIKNFSWKKFGQDIKDLFSKVKREKNENKEQAILNKRHATYSKEQASTDAHIAFIKDFEAMNKKGSAYEQERKQMIEDARSAFQNYSKEQETALLKKARAENLETSVNSMRNAKATSDILKNM